MTDPLSVKPGETRKLSNFPLYSALSGKIPYRKLTNIEQTGFLENVQLIGKESKELLIRLITEDEILWEVTGSHPKLYGCIITNGDSSFDLNNFPNRLQWILYRFITKTLDRDKEEKDRRDITNVKSTTPIVKPKSKPKKSIAT